jgi:hypothetical protein
VQKIPLLIASSRSQGGGALMDDAILAIKYSGGFLYKHEKFTPPTYEVEADGGRFCVRFEGELLARFDTQSKAQRWADFMSLKRLNR